MTDMMTPKRFPWRAAGLTASVALLSLFLAQCSYSYACDGTQAALILAAPGDAVTLEGRACVRGVGEPGAEIWVEVPDGVDDSSIRLSILDPVDGEETEATEGYPHLGLSVTSEHCEDGVAIVIEHVGAVDEPITALLGLSLAVEQPSQCEASLEAP